MIQLNNLYKPLNQTAHQIKLNNGGAQKFEDINKNNNTSAFANQFAQVKQNYMMSDEQRLNTIKEQSYEMETELVKIMVAQMQKSINKTGFIDGGQTEEIFTGMINDKYAETLSRTSNLGIAETMYQQITGLYR